MTNAELTAGFAGPLLLAVPAAPEFDRRASADRATGARETPVHIFFRRVRRTSEPRWGSAIGTAPPASETTLAPHALGPPLPVAFHKTDGHALI